MYSYHFQLWNAKRILMWRAQEAATSGTQTIGMTPRSSTPVHMDKPLKAKTKESCMETVLFKVETQRRFFGGSTPPANFQIALVRKNVPCLCF